MEEKIKASPEQVELAKVFSSVRLLGPPMGEKLIRLVAHLFSPEEAAVAKHLPFYYPRPLEKIAARAGKSPAEIKPLLERMGERRVIYAGAKGYALLPLIPGMFEYMLMDGRDSDWHREYAQLLIDLYSTGYVKQYNTRRLSAVRNIPVETAITDQTAVADQDRIFAMIDQHEHMGVLNVCQCRQSMRFVGKECKRAAPEDGCLVFGSVARSTVEGRNGRMVSREEMREIVKERWEKKLVFFTANIRPHASNAICTCCDCCCHGLETINHYGGMALLAPPHFLAQVDEEKCNHCGKCARACNTYAHRIVNKRHVFEPEKCIGCGLCVGECKQKAITMKENPAYRPPSRDIRTLGLKLLPVTAFAGLKAKLSRGREEG